VVEYLVEAERPFAARSRPYDEDRARKLMRRVVEHSSNIEWSLTDSGSFDLGDPWRERLGSLRAPTLVVHGTEDPLFPYEHAEALAREIPSTELLPLEATGHEYFPPHTWDVVVPAILSR
jgi:pimeloyl-ACP methyl ester carboxylesterase